MPTESYAATHLSQDDIMETRFEKTINRLADLSDVCKDLYDALKYIHDNIPLGNAFAVKKMNDALIKAEYFDSANYAEED